MHSRLMIVLIFILLLVLPVSAQDTDVTQYRLRPPTAAEYVGAFSELIHTAFDQARIYDPAILLLEEFNSYSNDELAQLPFSLLIDTYKDVKDILRYTAFDPEHWIYLMIQAAYHEAMFTLSESDSVEVTPDIILDITALDFDGDGGDEYLLHVTTMRAIESYILAYETAGNIAFAKVPVPSFEHDLPSRQSFEIFKFEDLDGDGTLEWLAHYHAESDRESTGRLYVLQWQDGKWTNLAPALFTYRFPLPRDGYRKPDYEITDTEIRMQYISTDGYGCTAETTHVLDWSSGNFTNAAETLPEDSVACIARDAENAHFQNRYLDAIPFYREAIERAELSQLAQYLTARMAIAYAFAGQIEDARRIITDIEHEGLMGDLLDQLEAAATREIPLEAMCHTMYDFIENVNAGKRTHLIDEPSPYGDDYPDGWFFGTPSTRDIVALPSPLLDGCNIYAFNQEERDEQSKDLHEDAEAAYKSIQSVYVYGDYARVLSLIDENHPLLTEYAFESVLYSVWYMNARSLELLGRSDDALAAYIALYEDFPESVWGMLARLHIEPVEG